MPVDGAEMANPLPRGHAICCAEIVAEKRVEGVGVCRASWVLFSIGGLRKCGSVPVDVAHAGLEHLGFTRPKRTVRWGKLWVLSEFSS